MLPKRSWDPWGLSCAPRWSAKAAAELTVLLCFCQLRLTTSHKSSCGSTLRLQTALLLFPTKPELSPATHFLRSEAPQFPRLIFLHEGAWLMLSSSCFSPHDVFLAPRTKLNSHQSLMPFLLFHRTSQQPRRTLLISKRKERDFILNTTSNYPQHCQGLSWVKTKRIMLILHISKARPQLRQAQGTKTIPILAASFL